MLFPSSSISNIVHSMLNQWKHYTMGNRNISSFIKMNKFIFKYAQYMHGQICFTFFGYLNISSLFLFHLASSINHPTINYQLLT